MEDLQSTSAELVYSQPLCVLGQFLLDATAPWSVASHWTESQGIVNGFAPFPHLWAHMCPKAWPQPKYVFIRNDGHQALLQPPNDEPFRVLEAGSKNFPIDLPNRRSLFCKHYCRLFGSLSALP